ncbi:MAG: FecR domain-containing protein [Alphaproteobacteria bacterium]|nr:FecR domain-containing protein [Alphaproteobacteria bacterium]MBU1516413.1 FecR domain-containing protein [Alphaproteobacteria bacterium]MBU2093350.1 FecR domain-containing protein [Alphaproteobacteria bacterium]MBU2153837.1 FecR domain-containing protein [Alphaproteobacteria bacterium]MBU2307709.1 FecR domain-containing protein [Alphaproteobacteria bacterium]
MSRPSPDLHDIAADWFMRSRASGWGPRDAAELDAWLAADPRHRGCFDDVAEAWQASAAAAASPGIRALRADALAARPVRAGPAPWMRLAAGLALVVVLLAGGLGAFHVFNAPPEVQVYRTGIGERATVTLADGSQATLNTASTLAVEYTRSRRGLRLLAGEAWFDVAKNPKRPFVVVAGRHSVTATGTSFDVRLDPDRLGVAVSEGRVLVAVDDRTPLAAVTAGQRAEVRGAAVLVAQAGPISGDWRGGRLQFDTVTLAEASAEMNRYRRVPIVLDDAAAGRLRISGVFDAGDGSSFIEALPLTHAVVVTRTPQAVRIATRPGK